MEALNKGCVQHLHQDIMASILITDFIDNFRILRLLTGGVKCTHKCTRNGVTEVIQLFVETASFTEAVVNDTVAESPQASTQSFVALQDFSYSTVDTFGAGTTLDNDPHPDTSSRSLQQSLCKPFISKVIGDPQDFASRGNCMDSLLENITQEARGAIRTSPENGKGHF